MRQLEELVKRLAAKAPEIVPEEGAWPCGCNGTGWKVDLETRAGAYCSCRTSRPIEDRIRLAGMLDERLIEATWENRLPPIYPSKAAIAEFPKPKSCLTLLGPVGTGKGHVAVAILREWLAEGESCRWIDAQEYVAALLARPFEEREPEIQALLGENLRLLVLDEAYSQKATPYADEVVSRIIRRRLDRLQPLIVITNFDQAQLEAAEPRVCSRISGSPALAFDFSGLPDRRRNA